MNSLNIFVYGRTKTKDYRWLVNPRFKLNSTFFARALEYNSIALNSGKWLFLSTKQKDFTLFSVFFLSKTERDERGRAISFAIGFECPNEFIREYNYRLPALISNVENFINQFTTDISLSVINDNSNFKQSIDISKFIPRYRPIQVTRSNALNEFSMYDLTNDTKWPMISNDIQLKKFENESIDSLSIDPNLSIAEKLLSQENTPALISNFDISNCGLILESDKSAFDKVILNSTNKNREESQLLREVSELNGVHASNDPKLVNKEQTALTNELIASTSTITNDKAADHLASDSEKSAQSNSLNLFERIEKLMKSRK